MSDPPLSPRKIPSQQRSIATVEAIVEGAARILEADGLSACTTEAIAARAGVSIGSLYQYFPGREAILASVLRRERATLLRDIEAALDRGAGDRDRLGAAVRAASRHQLGRPNLARALEQVEHLLPVDSETAALLQAISRQLVTLVARLGCADPATTVQDLIGLTRGMTDAAGLAGETDPEALALRIDRAVAGLLSGQMGTIPTAPSSGPKRSAEPGSGAGKRSPLSRG